MERAWACQWQYLRARARIMVCNGTVLRPGIVVRLTFLAVQDDYNGALSVCVCVCVWMCVCVQRQAKGSEQKLQSVKKT